MSIYTERPSLHPKLNGFNLSHNHYLTMDMGYLYPVGWQECLPGDVHQVDIQAIVRCLPLVKPILNNLTVKVDAFFVPFRILWKEWEDFYTTIKQDSIPPESYDGLPPSWGQHDDGTFDAIKLDVSKQSLWNRFGLNTKLGDILDGTTEKTVSNLGTYSEYLPVDFYRRAYYSIYNNWYRDENFQEPIDFRNNSVHTLLKRAWSKDYFTASLYTRQKGVAPSIPLSGNPKIIFPSPPDAGIATSFVRVDQIYDAQSNILSNLRAQAGGINKRNLYYNGSTLAEGQERNVSGIGKIDNEFYNYLTENAKLDLTSIITFDMNDLREMNAIQRQMEGLILYGSKFIEVLKGMWNTSPSDARLQIPERLGGFSFEIRVDEVIQTSSSTTNSPQGNPSGHAIGVTQSSIFTYKCEEPGCILILASVEPSSIYCNRFPREMWRKTRIEQVSPYFVNLGFQAIHNREIFGQLKDADKGIWAFQGMYDECRERQDYVSGQLLDNMSAYVSLRMFDSLPAMNSDFIECDPDDSIFSVVNEDKFIARFYFNMNSLRKLPDLSIPGLLDHAYGG